MEGAEHPNLDPAGGVRSRNMTEKGALYQLEVKQKRYKQVLSSVRASGQKLMKAVQENEKSEHVQAEFEKWKKLCQDLAQADEGLKPLLPPEDIEYHADRHSVQLEDNDAVAAKMIKFLTACKHEETDEVEPQDSASNLFMTSRTALSGRPSQVSNASNASSAKLREMQKQAELATRASLMKKKQEMKRRKLELQYEEEEHQLVTELAVSEAKTRAIDKFERELADSEARTQPVNEGTKMAQVMRQPEPTPERSQESDQAGRQQVVTSYQERDQAQAPPRHATDVVEGLVNLLREEVRQSHLPKLEPDVFHGDVSKFELWIKAFETYIESKTSSSVERLHYLGKYTAGEAKNAILGYIQLRSEDAYQQAKAKLVDRYGNEYIRASNYKNKIRSWPAIRSGDGKGLREFADFLEQVEAMSSASGHLRALDDQHENSMMLKKLPKPLVDRWRRYVDKRLYEPEMNQKAGYPQFCEFVKFMSKEARVACGPIQESATQEEREQVRRDRRVVRALQTAAAPATEDDVPQYSSPGCVVCAGPVPHPVDKCKVFQKMNLKERQAAVLKHGLCRGCLKRGHIWRQCSKKQECTICGRRHPTSLHDDAFTPRTPQDQDSGRHGTGQRTRRDHQAGQASGQPRAEATSLRVVSGVGDDRPGCIHSMILPVYVHHRSRPDNKILVYAVLDPQSDACFVTEAARSALEVEGQEVTLELKTVTGQSVVSSSAVQDLVVESAQGGDAVALPQCFSREVIPADRASIPRRESARRWPHLRSVADQLPLYHPSAEIGLLIGANCPKAVKPRDAITGSDDDPWAVRSVLGWGIVGPVSDPTDASACLYVDAGKGDRKLCHFAFRTSAREVASRGVSAAELRSSELWWHGPAFLSSTDPLPEPEVDTALEQTDPELKRASPVAVVLQTAASETTCFASLTERLERFSDWHRARRAVALCLRYRDVLLGWRSSSGCPLTVDELQKAQTVIVRAVQEEAFPEELKRLKNEKDTTTQNEVKTKQVKKTSKLYRLDPYIRADGVVCVGGRIRRANLPADQLHPVVLPRDGHITRLVVEHCHKGVHHAGRGMTIAEIRSVGFWIVGVRSAVSRHILKCVMCRKIRGTPQEQKMSDLPEDRLTPSEPFTYSGVDLFGPFYVKERRSVLKRWGVMFTCLASRSVHIETVNSLSTDSFLNAYRRFVGRRGPIRTLRCDRGTNFVGGKAAMEAALKEMDADKIQRELLKDNCDWIDFQMNAPCASHMGGAWERMIRSARAALDSVLSCHAEQLDDEVLRTVMVEVEAVINSRPLTCPEMTQVDVVEPLTPNQILTQKTKQVLPLPGRFLPVDAYCRHRWRRVQYLTNLFWSRWMSEVLPTLQERRRWTGVRRDLGPDDVVLLVEPDSPRNSWPLARVLTALPSRDGLVRRVRILTGGGRELERPVVQLVPLVRRDSRV